MGNKPLPPRVVVVILVLVALVVAGIFYKATEPRVSSAPHASRPMKQFSGS
jgi:hypothetical protein